MKSTISAPWALVVVLGSGGSVWGQDALRPVLTTRTARWEHEAGLEGDEEHFGAEHNPTGNPIGGGEGYNDIIAEGDYTVRTLDELRAALGEAKERQVVFIPDGVEIDMSGCAKLSIPAGVTLSSTRGHRGSEGALVFSNTKRLPGLFVTAGDCVRITGLRVRGPHPDRTEAPDSIGVFAAHFGFEVDNCDISAFACAGIYVYRGARRAYVHHNTIHHNQRQGLGYGVAINVGDVLVEANIFDWCRHHICGTGAPGEGYEARYNICRPNANGHLFDMHGQPDGSGIAGDWMNMHHNTFMCLDQTSIGIRGTPSQGTRIHHNWFHSPDPAKAVFVIACVFGPGIKNWAMRSIGDSRLGNSLAYRNVYGAERKLITREEMVEARLRFTRSNLRATPGWLRLSVEDPMAIARVQWGQLKALHSPVEEWPSLEARIKGMSKDEAIDVILGQLRLIETLNRPTEVLLKPE